MSPYTADSFKALKKNHMDEAQKVITEKTPHFMMKGTLLYRIVQGDGEGAGIPQPHLLLVGKQNDNSTEKSQD